MEQDINQKIAKRNLKKIIKVVFIFIIILGILSIATSVIIKSNIIPTMLKKYNTKPVQEVKEISQINQQEQISKQESTLPSSNQNTVSANSIKDLQTQALEKMSYDKLVEKLASSVVHIKGIYLTDTDDHDRYKLLHALGGEVFPPKKIKSQATCSGFFVSDDGYIVTNHHCIDDAQGIDVETKNGNKYTAKIIGYYEAIDLGVLKIEPQIVDGKKEKFNAVKIADSNNVNVGDEIVVIGGPLGYKWSASAGIISGKAREVNYTGNDYSAKKHTWGTAGEYIQVDAAVNGGNSGGPAFNKQGEVVGVASAGYTFLQGMKFIIASNTLREYLPRLKAGKIIQKGLWGISVNELEPYDVKAIGMPKNQGMIIHEVVKNSPAEQARIKRGDVILEINGKEIKDKITMRDVNNTIFDGSVSKIKINRYGDIKTLKVKATSVKEIEKLEKGEIGIQEWSDGNISYRLLTSKTHNKIRLPKQVYGIMITDIKNNDNPLLTLAVGDIIMGVNDYDIKSIEDYQHAIAEIKKNKKDMAVFHIYKATSDIITVKGSKLGNAKS